MAEFLTHASLAVPHGFFTRRGGVSEGAYASLNCSQRSEDEPTRVAGNRARAAASLGFPPASLLGLRQVHGSVVAIADAPWEVPPEADALVTRTPGLLLGVLTADCAPVLFADAKAGVVGAAHAGWRGAVAGVLEATIAAMEGLGAQASRIVAVVGPCIAQPSYEVAGDLVAALGPEGEAFLAPGRSDGRWQFDLAGYCLARLRGCGMAASLGRDTLAEADRFFSHRRRTLAGGGPIGHQLSAIGIGAG
jgi:YfiH family protein